MDAVAIEDRRKQGVDFPMQPFTHPLARPGIAPLEPAQYLSQMLDDRRCLKMDPAVVEQDRNLPPTRQRQKLRRLVHALLEADVAKREWLVRHVQHERHLVG